MVITTVQLKPDSIETVRALFEATNLDLVKGQDYWVSATFTANYAEDEVTVLAVWRNAESYRRFSVGEQFRSVMGQFASYFAGPPRVSVNEILFEM